ncbi:MAG: sigma-70 family RNA polymerase sigma factor [Isosphaeraceae bacterium]
MRTQHLPDLDGPRRWFLDAPEAEVMSAEHERRLLLELAECRRIILETTRRADGSPWNLHRPDGEFRRMVRGLAEGATLDTITSSDGDGRRVDATEALRRTARRYEEIRAALAMANSRLVAYIARRFGNRGIAPADLMQEGFCGLLEAIDRFDPINATRLATYATWWIRQALQRAIADGSYAVRLSPRQVRRLARSLRQVAVQARDGDDHDHDARQLGAGRAGGLGPDPDEAAYLTHHELASWTELAAIRPRISLDAVSGHDDGTPLADILALAPEDDSAEDEFAESVGAWLSELNQREQLVVRMRFGLDGCSHHSLSQIGEVLAVSKERVRQIQERALKKLREAAGCMGPVPEMAQEVTEPAGARG